MAKIQFLIRVRQSMSPVTAAISLPSPGPFLINAGVHFLPCSTSPHVQILLLGTLVQDVLPSHHPMKENRK